MHCSPENSQTGWPDHAAKPACARIRHVDPCLQSHEESEVVGAVAGPAAGAGQHHCYEGGAGWLKAPLPTSWPFSRGGICKPHITRQALRVPCVCRLPRRLTRCFSLGTVAGAPSWLVSGASPVDALNVAAGLLRGVVRVRPPCSTQVRQHGMAVSGRLDGLHGLHGMMALDCSPLPIQRNMRCRVSQAPAEACMSHAACAECRSGN